jgi:hypothetical protein
VKAERFLNERRRSAFTFLIEVFKHRGGDTVSRRRKACGMTTQMPDDEHDADPVWRPRQMPKPNEARRSKILAVGLIIVLGLVVLWLAVID